jgi:hypothetical protein
MSTVTAYESDREQIARLTGEELNRTLKTSHQAWSRDERNLARMLVKALAHENPHDHLARQPQKAWLTERGTMLGHVHRREQPVITLSSDKVQLVMSAYATVSLEVYPL